MSTPNKLKTPPKTSVRFDITLSEEQKLSKEIILKKPFNFILGKAGSGKTLLACQIALDMLFKRQVEQIVITRPTVSTEDNGFVPGDIKEKMDDWLVPIYSNFLKVYGHKDKLEKLEADGKILLVSLAHFRGRTFDDAICIVDEFQNLTKHQLPMVLSRLGKESSMILCGDEQQIDLKHNSESAVHECHKLQNSDYVSKIILKDNHRHPALDEILRLLNQSY